MSKINIYFQGNQRNKRLVLNTLLKTSSLLFFILLFTALLSLCLDADYVPNRDIIVVKTNQYGFDEWQKKIDSTFDDSAQSILIAENGDLVVAGSISLNRQGACLGDGFCQYLREYPRLIILDTNNGNLKTDFWYLQNPAPGRIETLIQTSDAGYLFATEKRILFKVDNNNMVIWNTTFNPTDYGGTKINSIIETKDGKYTFVGERAPWGTIGYQAWLGTIGMDGTLLEDRLFPNVSAFKMVRETPAGGFIIVNENNQLFNVNSYGDIIWSQTGFGEILDVGVTNGGYQVLVPGKEFSLNSQGNTTNIINFEVADHTIWTNNGGFATVSPSGDIRSESDRIANCSGIHISKFDGSGHIVWSRNVSCNYGGSIKSFIQTRDGGYAILLMTDKRK